MKVGKLLFILHDVTEGLVKLGLLNEDGDFTKPDLEHDFEVIALIEEVLKKYSVEVPEELDKIIVALPLLGKLIR